MNKKIQVLRGLAIIAVVIIHTYNQNYFGIYIRAVVNYAVALFLFCSGYLTKLSYDNLLRFYSKRISRILIPYIIWSCIYTITIRPDNLFKTLLYNLATGKADVIFYYVFVYIGLVIITPIASKMLTSKYQWIGWFISPVYMFFRKYIPVIPEFLIPYSSNFFFAWFTFYYLGMALGNHVIKYKRSFKETVFAYLLSIGVAIAEGLIWYSNGDYITATTQGKMSCLLSSSVACLLAYLYLTDNKYSGDSLVGRILTLQGNYSFGIYLAHIFVIKVLRRIPLYRAVPFPLTSLVVLVVTLVGLVIADRAFDGKLNKTLGIR